LLRWRLSIVGLWQESKRYKLSTGKRQRKKQAGEIADCSRLQNHNTNIKAVIVVAASFCF
jgi:hypothetical protein